MTGIERDRRFNQHFQSCLHDGDSCAIIFLSEKFKELLLTLSDDDRQNMIASVDGTFRPVPTLFYQLLTVNVLYKGHMLPAIHVLLSNKTKVIIMNWQIYE